MRRDAELRDLFTRLMATYAAGRSQAQGILKHLGLSVCEWRTLCDLRDAGPLSIQEIARLQRTDHSLISRLLPEMRRKGLVTISKNPADGRQVIVAIAETGQDIFDAAAPSMMARRAFLRDTFSDDEISQFLELLDRLEHASRVTLTPSGVPQDV